MSDHRKPWEPDPKKMGNWAAMFDPQTRHAPQQPEPSGPPRAANAFDDADLPSPDFAEYRPWTLQRGRSRPTLMLELRTYEPRSGLWSGIQLSYPTLLAIEYTGDRLLSLDFGTRQFAIEGRGLDELARHMQQGSVVSVQEFAARVWSSMPSGPIVAAIQKLSAAAGPDG